MNILHLATWDGYGAGRATARLHDGLRRLGHRSRMLVLHRQSDDPDVIAFRPDAVDRLGRLRRRYRRWRIRRDFERYRKTRPADAWMFSDDRTEHGDALARQLPACDVLTLHAVARMVDHAHFFRHLPAALPIVWRLPEMSPFTGGCHYADGCERFTRRCGACPQLGSADECDLTRRIWLRKDDGFRHVRGRLHLVAPSRWIAAEAQRSSLIGGTPVTVIPNGLDVEQWSPGDRAAVRRALGIPGRAKVVLFVASDVNNRLKGFGHAAEALAGLAHDADLLLLSVGSGRPPLRAADGVARLHLGRIECDRLLWMAYNAADVFVMPSLQESFGQTAVEAMACGTPVVAFATGGLLDTVRPGVTGHLAAPGDAAGLRDGIDAILRDPTLRAGLSANCRRVAVNEYAAELQARRFAELYGRLVQASAERRTGGAAGG